MEGWVDGWASRFGGEKDSRSTRDWGKGRVYIKVSLVKAVIDGDVAALQASRLAKGQGTS